MIKAGDTVTMMHDSFYHSGKPLHEEGQQFTVLGVETEAGHYSRLCPDIWIPDRVTGILLVGEYGWYSADSFYEHHIGEKVSKTSISDSPKKSHKPKPFKSGNLVNTIKGVITHPELGIPAYTFEEDDSYVECRRCKVLNYNEVRELTS